MKPVSRSARIRAELSYWRALSVHPATPRVSRWLLLGAAAYLLSPIDLIPDFIPILGHLDDVLIVPGMVALALLLIPDETKAEARRTVAGTP